MDRSIRVLVVDDRGSNLASRLEATAPELQVTAESSIEDVTDRESMDVDCLVLGDLGQGPTRHDDVVLDALTTIRAAHDTLPVVVYTDLERETVGDIFESGATDYVHRSSDTQKRDLLVRRILSVAEPPQGERVVDVLRACSRDLVRATSREDIHETVTDQLASSAVYECAWLGAYDGENRRLERRAKSGFDACDATVPAAIVEQTENPRAETLWNAVSERSLQTTRSNPLLSDDPSQKSDGPTQGEPVSRWAVLPLAFGGTVYGVLVLGTERTGAFDAGERRLLSQLGESIGHLFNLMDLSEKYTELLSNLPVEAFSESQSDSKKEGYFERVLQDIGDQQQELRDLANAKARFEALFEESPDMVFVHDEDGNIRDVNERACEKLGYERDVLRGMNVADLDATRGDDAIRNLSTDIAEGDSPMYDGVYEQRDGTTFPVEVHTTRLEGAESELLSIARDVSTRKQRERELRRQNERLEEFVDVLSHDIPNHLNVAKTRLDIARRTDDLEQLEHVDRAHDRIASIVDDMKALVTYGREVESTEWVHLADVSRLCWASFEEGDTGTLAVEPTGYVEANESRFKQLLENLFWNAREHAGPEVTVRVGLLDDGFFVEDDGPGIPQAERERVLTPGYTTEEDEHAGFGLAIVREIAHAHDWSLAITESEGRSREESGGARFEFRDANVQYD